MTMHANNTEIKDIYIARANYYEAVTQVLADSTRASDIEWFTDVYRNSYYDLTLAVKNFMIETQRAVEGNATTLMNNVYRAIMPGIIALGIAIVIIVMFYALINIYILRPILRITRGLGNYLNSKIPFNVRMEGMDELSQLKEYIDELMLALRKKEQ
jgi:methyl-accepting chemotaxis protein